MTFQVGFRHGNSTHELHVITYIITRGNYLCPVQGVCVYRAYPPRSGFVTSFYPYVGQAFTCPDERGAQFLKTFARLSRANCMRIKTEFWRVARFRSLLRASDCSWSVGPLDEHFDMLICRQNLIYILGEFYRLNTPIHESSRLTSRCHEFRLPS